MTDPDMGHWTYSYDALGNLTGQTDARTCTTSLTYDNLNRLTGKNYTGTCSTTPAVTYTYDEYNAEGDIDNNGYRTGMNDANSGTTWRYDSRGRVETETRNIPSSGSFQTQWAYNSADQVTSMIYPDGEVLANTYLPQMTLDTMIGTISGVNTTYVSDSKYDAVGRITTRVFNPSNFRQVYSYVPWASVGGGSLDMVKAGTNASSYNNILNLDYTYDVDRNITSIYDGNLLNTQTFTYDALNRLTSAVSTGGASAYALENTTYNATTGNLASKAGISYTYADTAHKHAVTSLSNGNTYTYDANGNQITRKVGSVTHTLTYDGENRLTKVMNGSTTIASFVYDGDGQRVKSTLNGVTTTFVGNYYEKTGTNITKYYYMGAARVAMRNTSVKYLFGDQLGSTSVTTSSSGVIGSQERYKPFGEMYYTSGTLPTRYTFTGQYSYTINTNEIGLMYYGARFYDPALGRFASADTIIPQPGNPQSWDRFSYTLNNPVKYTDPSGHRACIDQDQDGQCITDPLWYTARNPKGINSSPSGIEFIKEWETFQPRLYDNDGAGNCTIGYGHLVHYGLCNGDASEQEYLNGITANRAEEIIRQDIELVEGYIDQYVNVKLKQNEFDALVSFTFNVGAGYGDYGDADAIVGFSNSTLLEYINDEKSIKAVNEFGKWIYPLSAPGLIIRRIQEATIFLLGYYDASH